MQNHYTVLNTILAKLWASKNWKDNDLKNKGLNELSLITITHEYNEGYEKHVLYFYCKSEQFILPINLFDNQIETILASTQRTFLPTQNIYHITNSVVSLLKGGIKGIIINSYKSGDYYSHILVSRANTPLRSKLREVCAPPQDTFEIKANLIDALGLALHTNAQIYAENNFLREFGFRITKDLIRKAIGT